MTGVRAVLRARVGEDVVVLDASSVRAVLIAPSASPFPGAEESLRGLIAWRDHVVPLVTLAPTRRGRLAIVLDQGAELVALEVDAVEGPTPDSLADTVPIQFDDVARLVRAGRAGALRSAEVSR